MPVLSGKLNQLRVVLLILNVLYAFVQCTTPLHAADKGIRLNQSHFFFGETQLVLSPSGIRMENKSRLRFIVVGKPPDWKVTIFRNDDKVYISRSLKNFEEEGLVSDFVSRRDGRIFDHPYRQSSFMFSGKKLNRLTSRDKTFKYLPLNGLPPEISRIIYAAYRLPTDGGITVGYNTTHYARDMFSGSKQRGCIEEKLSTRSIEDISTDDKMFLAPRGYRLARSVREVVAGAATRKKDPDYKLLFYKD